MWLEGGGDTVQQDRNRMKINFDFGNFSYKYFSEYIFYHVK